MATPIVIGASYEVKFSETELHCTKLELADTLPEGSGKSGELPVQEMISLIN